MQEQVEARHVKVDGLDARVCYDAVGHGPDLVLLHAAQGERVHFRWNGLVDALDAHHRLVLIDALAHGASDGPLEPEAYTMPLRVAQVTSVLDDLGVERAHVLGYSMGGHTAMGMVEHAPERLRSIVVGGMGPKGPQLDGQYTQEQLLAAARGGMAIAAVAAALAQIGDQGEALAKTSVESFFFCGSLDPLNDDARRGAELSGGQFVELEGMAHRDVYKGGIVEIVPALRRFLAACNVPNTDPR